VCVVFFRPYEKENDNIKMSFVKHIDSMWYKLNFPTYFTAK